MHEGYEPGTALVVVDAQNDVADPAGGLVRASAERVAATASAGRA
jgi:nicotinamidase-related amidase